MEFNWTQFLNLAEQLSRNADEASQRSAISRAYYFVYHVANDRAVANLYKRPEDGTSHNSLWSYYERNNNEECRRIAIIGRRLHQRRVRADYNNNYPRISEEMVEVILSAQRCASIMESLPPQFPEDPPARVFSV